MTNFRYSRHAQDLDIALVEELDAHVEAKQATDEASVTHDKDDTGLSRVARGGSVLDEVQSIIAAKQAKAPAAELAEYRVKKKLSALRTRDQDVVQDFLRTRS